MTLFAHANLTWPVYAAIDRRGHLGATCLELRQHVNLCWRQLRPTLRNLQRQGCISIKGQAYGQPCKRRHHVVYVANEPPVNWGGIR